MMGAQPYLPRFRKRGEKNVRARGWGDKQQELFSGHDEAFTLRDPLLCDYPNKTHT